MRLTVCQAHAICFSTMRKTNPTRLTVFMRHMRGHGIEHQRQICEREARRRGAVIVAEYIAGDHDGHERDEWIIRTRPAEGAMVAGLYVIPEPAVKGTRPSADFASALQRLVRRVALIVDAETGTTSDDGGKWDKLVISSAHKVSAGRQLSRNRAKAMNAKARAKAGPGIVEKWAAPNMKRELARWSQHWRDVGFKSAAEAFASFPAEIQAEIGSIVTARRIFGRRRPGDPSAGGRPKAKTTRGPK